ncbi:hypothetical protein ZOSMA_248G00250 [Zostera marina]|uniref:HMA domain-containing protein n=1 Tax=Zostera marina TaxID=29655 RepID=A0A0K9PGW7_ZOSMR|nr:hypothetical protein ZOSMA_248G00250 [Zostera marina]
MKKIVIKLDIQDCKAKQKALKTACTVSGIDSISVDMDEKKITIIGDVDPIKLASKLRKNWDSTEIFSVEPAKEPEPEKKEEPKKTEEAQKVEEPKKEDEPKKVVDEPKKAEGEAEVKKVEEPKKEDGPKKEEEKKSENYRKDPIEEPVKSYRVHYPQYTTQYYVQSVEENPNSCVIF